MEVAEHPSRNHGVAVALLHENVVDGLLEIARARVEDDEFAVRETVDHAEVVGSYHGELWCDLLHVVFGFECGKGGI